jgi:hypothetical protein
MTTIEEIVKSGGQVGRYDLTAERADLANLALKAIRHREKRQLGTLPLDAKSSGKFGKAGKPQKR